MVEQPARSDCHDGMVKNGHTRSMPAFVPVVAHVAKTPSVPGAGGPVVGGLGSFAGKTANVVDPGAAMAAL